MKRVNKVLSIVQVGDPVLRAKAKKLTKAQIQSIEIKKLIKEMKALAKGGKYGVGLAAPQVGKSLAFSVITIRPTPSHPEREIFETVIINPEIIKYVGNPVAKWEGCMSFGTDDSPMFAQTKRHETIKVAYLDESGNKHTETLDGLKSHIFQHEVDHLNGIMFVDRISDSKTWMSAEHYKKMLAEQSQPK